MRLTVQEVMTQPVLSVRGDAGIDETISLLLKHNVSGLPVVDDDDCLIGFISERDLLGVLYDLETDRQQIIDYATKEVISVSPDDSLLGVTDHFMSRPIRSLPVVDQQLKLIGTISRRDMIGFIRDVRLRIGGVLEKRRQTEATMQ